MACEGCPCPDKCALFNEVDMSTLGCSCPALFVLLPGGHSGDLGDCCVTVAALWYVWCGWIAIELGFRRSEMSGAPPIN